MHRPNASRNQKGSVVEFAVSLPLVVVAISLAINLALGLLGVRAVDLAARDAARAASLQQTRESALSAAKAALEAHRVAGVNAQLDESSFVFDKAIIAPGTPYSGPGPIVQVTVDAGFDLPFKELVAPSGQDKKMSVSRSYTFPIMKLPKPGPVVAGGAIPSV